jgi:hypothetical protein
MSFFETDRMFFSRKTNPFLLRGSEIFCAPSAQVIDAENTVASGQQGINKVASNESGSAGDNASHVFRN